MKFDKDKLSIEVFDDRELMGIQAGKDIVASINQYLNKQEEVNIIFATAPSQRDVFNYLKQTSEIDWSRVNALHMDEYHTLENHHSARFGNFLHRELFSQLDLNHIYYLKENNETKEEIIEKYTNLLKGKQVDLIICGIGENGHLAFNDPHVAKFDDKEMVKIVGLDEGCRMQHVNDGCFASVEEVPVEAITLTIPALMSGKELFCVVPGKLKHQAVHKLLNDPISESLPASIIRTHEKAKLYLDFDAYKG